LRSAEPAEIALIEVWRPHRHNVHNRRSADRNRGPRRAQNGAGAASEPGSVPGQGESGGEGEPRRDGGKRFGDRHGEGRPRGPRRDFAAGGDDRRPKPDFKGGKGPRRDERPRTMQSEPPRERERQPDPNSPFAKLAALKAQLEGK
jgi:ATP-dependent RNA helicase SUPV3L1/SUV3